MSSVFSRTITKSRSSRRLRAPLYALTGRTSAYRSSSWRRATLTLLNPEPTGVVIGPFSATLCLRIEASNGSGSGVDALIRVDEIHVRRVVAVNAVHGTDLDA